MAGTQRAGRAVSPLTWKSFASCLPNAITLSNRLLMKKSRATLGTLSAVEFKGVLEVTEPEEFIKTFRKGVGSTKAFGFGLLALAPAS
jgi:CRISPR-associated protein Cas6/Cse3/CasE subtype I-E